MNPETPPITNKMIMLAKIEEGRGDDRAPRPNRRGPSEYSDRARDGNDDRGATEE